MLRRPFRGTTQMQLAASILRDPMPAISKPGVPAELSDLIERCLAKNPDERLSSARLLAKGLQSIKSGSSPVSTAGRGPEGFWVAVASFKSTGASAEVAALAEGLTEEIMRRVEVSTRGLVRVDGAHHFRETEVEQFHPPVRRDHASSTWSQGWRMRLRPARQLTDFGPSPILIVTPGVVVARRQVHLRSRRRSRCRSR